MANEDTPPPTFRRVKYTHGIHPKPDALYRPYQFSLLPLSPLVQKLKDNDRLLPESPARLSNEDLEDAMEKLREAWISMLREAHKIYKQNLTCPGCRGEPHLSLEHISDSHRSEMKAIRDQTTKDITNVELETARKLFLRVEDAWLEEQSTSSCSWLWTLRDLKEIFREMLYGHGSEDGNNQELAPNASNDAVQHAPVVPNTQIAESKTDHYASYPMTMEVLTIYIDLLNEATTEDGIQKAMEELRSVWGSTVQSIKDVWQSNMRCTVCNVAPGDDDSRHRLPEAWKPAYAGIFDEILAVEPAKVTQRLLTRFEKTIHAAEDVYLKDNFYADCRGLEDLRKTVADLRIGQGR